VNWSLREGPLPPEEVSISIIIFPPQGEFAELSENIAEYGDGHETENYTIESRTYHWFFFLDLVIENSIK
jgi:hypothetical protein